MAPPNVPLKDVKIFLPDVGPNAVSDILVCGRFSLNEDVDNLSRTDFHSPQICVNYNDLAEVVKLKK
ncbi:MAG: hypothetical protein ACK5LJ_11040 [Paracoccus sp. (in: a-proteobacteria)]